MISNDTEDPLHRGDHVVAMREKAVNLKATRIQDVARVAGVSTATVSHVINDTKHVTAITRASVLSAIERCNYYPKAQARSLALGRTVIAELTEPPLTAICLSRVELGRRTVESLIRSIRLPHERAREVRIPTHLIKRGSTAPPRLRKQ
jgi:DNA-binding LacI/PurR family transcriptional regulator